MPAYAIAIVAHLDRLTQAEQLADRTDARYIAYDDGTLGCEGNHMRVWDWHHVNTTGWAVTLEDDAQPVEGFREQLEQALSVAPAPIVSLYAGTGHPLWEPRIRAALRDHPDTHWLLSTNVLHAVGLAIHTSLLPLQVEPHLPIDTAISNWAKRHDHLVAYTVPSLVDHADTQPVITQRYDRKPRTMARKAIQVGGRHHWTRTHAPLA